MAPSDSLEDRYNQLLGKHNKLEATVNNLNATINKIQAENIITQQVNKILHQQFDALQQYSRRSCMVVDRIPVDATESININNLKNKIKKTVTKSKVETEINFKQNYDKCHRIGPIRDGKQSCIIKFRTHSFREKLYKERKKLLQKISDLKYP